MIYNFVYIVDGEWGPYSAFTPCTASCGNGTKTRIRQCDNPAPKYGGNPCVGEPEDTTHCYERPCPIGKNKIEITILINHFT